MSRHRLLLVLAVAALCVAVIAGGVLYGSSRAPGIGGPFTLTASDGRTVTEHSFRGKYLLVYFGYTICPDVCSTSMADLATALEKLGPKADLIQPLFITLDPKRDTAAVLKAYTAQFWPTLLGLTGTPDQIAAVEKEYKVYSAVHRTGSGPDDYLLDHSSVFYLIGPDGDFIAPIDSGQSGDDIAAALQPYLH